MPGPGEIHWYIGRRGDILTKKNNIRGVSISKAGASKARPTSTIHMASCSRSKLRYMLPSHARITLLFLSDGGFSLLNDVSRCALMCRERAQQPKQRDDSASKPEQNARIKLTLKNVGGRECWPAAAFMWSNLALWGKFGRSCSGAVVLQWGTCTPSGTQTRSTGCTNFLSVFIMKF